MERGDSFELCNGDGIVTVWRVGDAVRLGVARSVEEHATRDEAAACVPVLQRRGRRRCRWVRGEWWRGDQGVLCADGAVV